MGICHIPFEFEEDGHGLVDNDVPCLLVVEIGDFQEGCVGDDHNHSPRPGCLFDSFRDLARYRLLNDIVAVEPHQLITVVISTKLTEAVLYLLYRSLDGTTNRYLCRILDAIL